jgi:hypothetical protein
MPNCSLHLEGKGGSGQQHTSLEELLLNTSQVFVETLILPADVAFR